jgi:hypothetical protein
VLLELMAAEPAYEPVLPEAARAVFLGLVRKGRLGSAKTSALRPRLSVAETWLAREKLAKTGERQDKLAKDRR